MFQNEFFFYKFVYSVNLTLNLSKNNTKEFNSKETPQNLFNNLNKIVHLLEFCPSKTQKEEFVQNLAGIFYVVKNFEFKNHINIFNQYDKLSKSDNDIQGTHYALKALKETNFANFNSMFDKKYDYSYCN